MESVDAIVAGAGIWGCTVARRLAEAGRKVLVLLPLYFIGRIEFRVWRYALLILVAAPFAAPVVAWCFETLGMGHYADYYHSTFRSDGFEWMFFAINMAFLLFSGWYWARAKKACRCSTRTNRCLTVSPAGRTMPGRVCRLPPVRLGGSCRSDFDIMPPSWTGNLMQS